MSDVLSQDEINALLKGLSEGEIDSAPVEETKTVGTKSYDLASQERIIRGRMPTMELIHDRFARSFRTSLSKFLGRSSFVSVGSIEILKFGQFMKKLPLPSSLHIYRMPPLLGYALLVASTPFVFTVIDCLFGGKGNSKVKIEGREFTTIETRLIGKVVMMALEVLKDAWSPIHALDMVYVRTEFNPLAIAIVPPTDVVIIVTIEIELENESTSITLCTPYSTVEPIRQKLSTGFQSSRLEMNSNASQRMSSNLLQTEINMTVELARGDVKARDLMDLSVGDIIPLETNPTEEALICVEGVPKYKGFVGTYHGSRAVRMTQAIHQPKLED